MFRIVAQDKYNITGEYEVKEAKFYDIIKDGTLHANTFSSVLPAIIPNGMKGQVMGNVPSFFIRIADLLKVVNEKDENSYVKNYNAFDIFMVSVPLRGLYFFIYGYSIDIRKVRT